MLVLVMCLSCFEAIILCYTQRHMNERYIIITYTQIYMYMTKSMMCCIIHYTPHYVSYGYSLNLSILVREGHSLYVYIHIYMPLYNTRA